MTNNFLSLLGRLAQAEVDFVMIGGFAGVVHSCTYVTQDVEICGDSSPAIHQLLRLVCNTAVAQAQLLFKDIACPRSPILS